LISIAPIIRGKLGVRASAVYQHEEFRQKPSGTTSRRYNAMLRAQPFKNTTFRAIVPALRAVWDARLDHHAARHRHIPGRALAVPRGIPSIAP
jgi:hypothetical protein